MKPEDTLFMFQKFPLGQIVSTRGALTALERNQQSPGTFLRRHASGDWGVLDAEDKRLNDAAIRHEERILSAYLLKDGTKIWIITEADRASTTVLLPEEY